MCCVSGQTEHALTRRKQRVARRCRNARQISVQLPGQKEQQQRGASVYQQEANMYAGRRLPKSPQNRRVCHIRPRQFHVVGKFIRRNALQNQLAGVSVFALIPFERHLTQSPANRPKKKNYDCQQRKRQPPPARAKRLGPSRTCTFSSRVARFSQDLFLLCSLGHALLFPVHTTASIASAAIRISRSSQTRSNQQISIVGFEEQSRAQTHRR